MKINIYALYSPYIQCYDLPVTSGLSPEDYCESYRRLIKQQPDMAHQNFLHEKKLCLIGFYDDVSGLISPQQPQVLVDLASFFDPGYLAKKQVDSVKYFQGVQNGTAAKN